MSRRIDLAVEDLRPAQEIILANLGKRVAPSTFWRWRLHGVNGTRLKCVRSGRDWLTTPAAFAAFLQGQTRHASQPKSRAPKSLRKSEAAHAD